MHEIILCKLGEVVLKGLNRRSFEMKLMSNLRRRTARFGRFRVYSKQSTIYVEPAGEACDLDGAYDACKRVFGIIAVARALPCAKEKEAILDTAKTYLSSAPWYALGTGGAIVVLILGVSLLSEGLQQASRRG